MKPIEMKGFDAETEVEQQQGLMKQSFYIGT